MNTSQTDDLIHRLAVNATAIRPLGRPWTRALLWSVGALAYVAVVDWLWPETSITTANPRFMWEQAAALTTGLTAAAVAFATVVPGRSRRVAFLPLLPLAIWFVSVGQQCAQDWSASRSLPPILGHWACFPLTVLMGVIPSVAIVVMLRRGAPLTPRLTTALGALAVAGLANFGVRFVHAADASFVVLTWHLIAVFGLSLLLARLGDHVFRWRKTTLV